MMRRIYYFSLLTLFFLFSANGVKAQTAYTNQIIVCSGGNFSDPEDFVTVSSVSPDDGSTLVFDTIYTQSVQHVITHRGFAFVAAQDSIVKYNLDDYSRVAVVAAQGVNQLATDGNLLLASFWFPVTENFVKAFTFDELSLKMEYSEISGDAAGILIKGGIALVAIPGPWGSSSGKIASIDLGENIVLSEDDNGEFYSNIGFFANWNNVSTAFMKTAWGETTFGAATMNEEGEVIEEFTFENASLANPSGQIQNKLYIEVNNGIAEFDLESSEFSNPEVIAPQLMSIGASVLDTINHLIYLTTSDFSSVGEGFIYDFNGNTTGVFDAGISAQAIAIDYRLNTKVSEREITQKLSIYPNPAKDVIYLDIPQNQQVIKTIITDITGQIVYSGNNDKQINIDIFSTGFYFTTVETSLAVFTGKFIKK